MKGGEEGECCIWCTSAAVCSVLVDASGRTMVRSSELGWKVWMLRQCSGGCPACIPGVSAIETF